jgi:hypothetical protein
MAWVISLSCLAALVTASIVVLAVCVEKIQTEVLPEDRFVVDQNVARTAIDG